MWPKLSSTRFTRCSVLVTLLSVKHSALCQRLPLELQLALLMRLRKRLPVVLPLLLLPLLGPLGPLASVLLLLELLLELVSELVLLVPRDMQVTSQPLRMDVPLLPTLLLLTLLLLRPLLLRPLLLPLLGALRPRRGTMDRLGRDRGCGCAVEWKRRCMQPVMPTI